MTYTPLAAVVLLFLAVGIGFIFVHLLAGKFIRPNKPDVEKKTVYECGEPTVGSAWIQFDLRFYVVALLFVIFDVEVAFFFPWAEVFGRAQAVVQAEKPDTTNAVALEHYGDKVNSLLPDRADLNELRERNRTSLTDAQFRTNQESARDLLLVALSEIVVFFGVLLVGFAYLWRRGDLEWVRSTLAERPATASGPPTNGAGSPAARSDVPAPYGVLRTEQGEAEFVTPR